MNYTNLKTHILYWTPRILLFAFGIFAIVFGEFDDSPGLQGIGLILAVGVVVNVVRNRKKKI